ncbi:MAG TPA: M20/M25/M40 family metallo-hydrolase [Chitinophagaceae bacterium]
MRRLVTMVVLFSLVACSAGKGSRTTGDLSDARLLTNLKKHVVFLADDRLEGRRAGSTGETLAMEYIADAFREIGLEPKGTVGYVQTFEVNEGKQVDPSGYLKINEKDLRLNEEYFPLAFSANATASGTAAVSLRESGAPWFVDVREWLEENKSNPHYDINASIISEAQRAASKNATMLILYNSNAETDNIQFNKNDKTETVSLPVIYITPSGVKKFLSDRSAALDISLKVQLGTKTRTAHNVAGYIDNGAPQTVILGAHFDHLGYGTDKNALDTGYVVHNGADDNASGTAALIELARMLKKNGPDNNNYLFLAFSGEELGLLGSKYWLEHPTVTGKPNYMINLDMVGRYDSSRKLTIGGFGTSPVWSDIISTANPGMVVKLDSSGSGPSDHASFYRKDIPVLFFFTGSHSDYHKATDDEDRINYEGTQQVVRFAYNIVQAADNRGQLAFLKTREPDMGRSSRFTVSLGVIPDYGYSGTGVRIDGVSPGKLAEKTGLQAGDILLQLGEFKFVDVSSYMQALSRFKKGDKTTLRIKRDTEEKEFSIQFQ